jgi:hypothetical protein
MQVASPSVFDLRALDRAAILGDVFVACPISAGRVP